ncbi:MAG: hypothetical protein BIFFINMI_00150 [Phycisphaerae bacterium]|nr:hypothetical protein [Phycisphaerae bacterium]
MQSTLGSKGHLTGGAQAVKVYIMVDMEGISGIVDIAYMDQTSDFYRTGRTLLTEDMNAAVAGCFDGGADEVWVLDAHSQGCNIEPALLDERAILDKNRSRWCGSLDETFDATLIVGQHAMAGTLNGFLDHTQSSKAWFSYSINGRPIGEIGQWATMAGHFDVPLIYLAGDQAACDEAADLIPGIVTTAVKKGVGRNRAVGMHPNHAHATIRRDAARAVAAKKSKFPRPLKWKLPMTCRLEYYRSDMADDRALRGDVVRIDARTLEKKCKTQADILL